MPSYDLIPGTVETAGSSLTVAVIGHVNHGKTALVRALTGIETDRLKEEIQRGLSITLGFAWRDYGSCLIDFIDAPGHEDFVRATVAGVSGARAVLLVVSASEGVARQTREHLQIASLLGITNGVVALTKADLLTADELATRRALVETELKGTILEGAPLVACSALGSDGLGALHSRLEDLAARCPPPPPLAGAFLAIDRAFTITGTGTVVTGTLLGGPLNAGDEMVLWPSGRPTSLRRLQARGQSVTSAQSGGRVAVNLRGVNSGQVRAGDALCAPGDFEGSLQVDVEIAVLADAGGPLKHMDQVRVLLGTRRDMASLRLMGVKKVVPGGRALAQLRFAAPVIAFAGQRGVMRRPSPAETLAGVTVLDPSAAPSKGRDDYRAALAAAAVGDLDGIVDGLRRRDGGIVAATSLARLARRPVAEARRRLEQDFTAIDVDRWALSSAVADATAAYLELLRTAHRAAPARATAAVGAIRSALASTAPRDMIAHVEATLAASGAVRLSAGQVAMAGHDPFAALSPQALTRLTRMEDDLCGDAVAPRASPDLAGIDAEGADLLRLLIESGRAVMLRNVALRQTVVFHRDALSAAFHRLREAYPPPAAFTTGEARASLSTTRKYIVPLLEHFDALGLTERTGDFRRVAESVAAAAQDSSSRGQCPTNPFGFRAMAP